jgi:hypothetical protein
MVAVNCLKQHASRFMLIFMEILKMYLKVKYYYEVNKECNLHIATGTHNQCKLPKRGQYIQN